MTEPKHNHYSFELIKFIKNLWRWKLPLIIFSGLMGVLTYIFTGPAFITPLYKATVIFYPTTNSKMSTTVLTEPGSQGYNVIDFGTDEDAEQLLQILKSEELKNRVIIKYQLAKNYGFDTTQQISMLTMRSLFDKNYEARQTEYKAIQVTVFDSDAQRAADMANFIAEHADYQKNAIQKVKAKQAYEIVKAELDQQVHMMDSMEVILLKLREKGIYDYFEQSSQLNQALTTNTVRLQQEEAMLKVYEDNKDGLPDTLIVKTKARINGYKAAIKSIKPIMDQIKAHGGEYLKNVNTLELERKKLLSLKSRYESAKIDYEQALPQKFIINAADKPEIPSKPRRLLTTFIAMLSAFAFGIILIPLINSLPNIIHRFREQ